MVGVVVVVVVVDAGRPAVPASNDGKGDDGDELSFVLQLSLFGVKDVVPGVIG